VSLEAFESALARLATDDALRARFAAAPAETADALGLDGQDAERLAALDRDRLDLFAEQLRLKRYGEVRAQLPRALAALGDEELRRRFLVFAAGFLPEGVNKHRADALAYAGSLGEVGRFDHAALRLFWHLDGHGARARRGPAVVVMRDGSVVWLLVRARDASRYWSWRVVRTGRG
jgi:hypothetical protein